MNCDRGICPRLTALVGGRLSFNVPLKDFTTLGVGGSAQALVRPDTPVELSRTIRLAREAKMPLFILGAGSNILFTGGFEGLIINLGNGFKAVEQLGEGRIKVGAAAGGQSALGRTAEWGLRGLEGLTGVPCTLGGALVMNAGSGGQAIGEVVESLSYADINGQIQQAKREDLHYSYRRLDGLPPEAVIIEAVLALVPDSPDRIKADIRERLVLRNAGQPKGVRSAGSVFKNPSGCSAGRLIDECGLKGTRVGDAEVSEVHANFIVNRGAATAGDILTLMRKIIAAVQERHGLTLEPEIKIIGPVGEVKINDI